MKEIKQIWVQDPVKRASEKTSRGLQETKEKKEDMAQR